MPPHRAPRDLVWTCMRLCSKVLRGFEYLCRLFYDCFLCLDAESDFAHVSGETKAHGSCGDSVCMDSFTSFKRKYCGNACRTMPLSMSTSSPMLQSVPVILRCSMHQTHRVWLAGQCKEVNGEDRWCNCRHRAMCLAQNISN